MLTDLSVLEETDGLEEKRSEGGKIWVFQLVVRSVPKEERKDPLCILSIKFYFSLMYKTSAGFSPVSECLHNKAVLIGHFSLNWLDLWC